MLLHNSQFDCRPPDQRFTQWVSEISQFLGQIEFDSPLRHNFRQQLVRAEIDGVAFCRSRGSAMSARRRHALKEVPPMSFGHQAAAVASLHASQSYCLLLKLGMSPCTVSTGHQSLDQVVNEVVLQPGDMLLMKMHEPFAIAHAEESDSTMISIPASLAQQWIESPDEAIGQLISGQTGWAAVLSAYLGSLDLSQLHAADHEISRVAPVDHIMRLLSVTLAPSTQPVIPDRATQRLLTKKILYRRIVAWIRENHMETSMSAARTAQHFQVSMRYIHKLFADVNPMSSFLQTLTTARLQAAAAMLRNADGLNIRVADVGYRCGFPDASHFGRVFRERYACTPRAYMLAAMNAGEEADPEIDDISSPDSQSTDVELCV